MASQSEIDSAKSALRELLDTVGACGQIGAVLVEHGRPLVGEKSWMTTDFERARDKVRECLRTAEHRNDRLRREVLSADLVRAAILLEEVQACCDGCLQHNKQCGPGLFTCLVVTAGRTKKLPFTLDSEGNIHEQR